MHEDCRAKYLENIELAKASDRQFAYLLRMLQAGVIITDYASLMVEILKDNSRPDAGAIYRGHGRALGEARGPDRSGVRHVGIRRVVAISEVTKYD